MAITLGGHSSGYGDGVTAQATGSLGTVVTGSTVAVGVTFLQNASEVVSSVTDNFSNTYSLCTGSGANGNGEFVSVYRATNVTGGAAFVVTANFSGSAGVVSVFAVEIKGADTTASFVSAVAQYQAAAGTGTDAVTSTAASSPGVDGSFIFGVMSRQSGIVDTLSAGTGFTILDRTQTYHAGSEYFIQTTAATVAATFTQDFAGDTVCAVATFKPASSTTLDQEGFSWYNDDGSESGSTAYANQDTNITAASSTTKRLRMLVNATGDPATKAYKLQYRIAAGSWADVL